VRLLVYCLIAAVILIAPAVAQDRAADVKIAFAHSQHLKRGINVSHWFSQNAQDYSAHHTDTETTPDDIALIAKLGFDNVRLSVDATPLEAYPHGADGLNDEFMARLDHALDMILSDGMAVQVDLHPEEPYKQGVRSNNAAVDKFVQLWRRLAAHYANRDPERVFFEIMNEPEENDPYR
jgi:endoglucanase